MIRSSGKNKTDFGVKDIYLFYKDNQIKNNLVPIEESEFRRIIRQHNEEVCKTIVEDSTEFRMPYRLGYLRIRKFKTRLKIDADGKLKTSHMYPNWSKTKELWDSNPEAKANKKLVFHDNSHSNRFYYKWYWDKRVCNIKNSSVYRLVISRTNKRRIAEVVKNNNDIDYYE